MRGAQHSVGASPHSSLSGGAFAKNCCAMSSHLQASLGEGYLLATRLLEYIRRSSPDVWGILMSGVYRLSEAYLR